MTVIPWPETLAAMDVAEALLDGDDSGVTDACWSPNMDLDLPRAERLDALQRRPSRRSGRSRGMPQPCATPHRPGPPGP